MASMTIREFNPEGDAPAIVALLRAVSPDTTIDVASWLHRIRSVPERSRARAWVAEADGRFAGYAEAYLHPFNGDLDHGYVNVLVDPAQCRHGIGSALYEQGDAYVRALDPTLLVTTFRENAEGVRFAEARGFALARAEQIAVVDPREVRDTPPEDVELRAAADIDLHDLYVVDEGSMRDMPALGEVSAFSYEEWRSHVLDHPLFTLDGSFVAYVEDEPAACSMLIVDRETGHATNMFTGTLAAFRGRGLGRAAKLASMRWAAENGVTTVATMNDETNAPMLAINRRLGYRPAGRRVEYVKEA